MHSLFGYASPGHADAKPVRRSAPLRHLHGIRDHRRSLLKRCRKARKYGLRDGDDPLGVLEIAMEIVVGEVVALVTYEPEISRCCDAPHPSHSVSRVAVKDGRSYGGREIVYQALFRGSTDAAVAPKVARVHDRNGRTERSSTFCQRAFLEEKNARRLLPSLCGYQRQQTALRAAELSPGRKVYR